jgi:ribosomal protein S27E
LLPEWLRHIRIAKGLNMPLVRDFYIFPCTRKRKNIKSPNLYFKDVKCPGGYKITLVFSHVQTVLSCAGCLTVQCHLQEEKPGSWKEYYWSIKLHKFMFCHRNYNLVTLQDNANIFDFERHKKMTFYFLLFQ